MTQHLVYQAKRNRQQFVDFLFHANLVNRMHISRHFCERLVERKIEMGDVLHMLLPLISIYKTKPDLANRSYCVKWRGHTLCASIVTGAVSRERRIDLKTAYRFEQPYGEHCDEFIIMPDRVIEKGAQK